MRGVGLFWALMQQQYWSLYAHNVNVGRLSCAMADELRLPDDERERICSAASLHDLGKLFISRSVLEKTSRLEGLEWEHVRRHTRLGATAIIQMDHLKDLEPLVLYHHERWDGSGYEGLQGENIPLGARIIAVADTVAAMTEPRSYRQQTNFDGVIRELLRCKGTQFDPLIVDLALDCQSLIANLVENPSRREAVYEFVGE